MRRGAVWTWVAVAGVACEALLRLTALGLPVERSRAEAATGAGRVESAIDLRTRIALRSDRPADDLELGRIRFDTGRLAPARTALERATSGPSAVRADALHLLSALHLREAGVEGPGPAAATPSLTPGPDRSESLRRAVRTARAALRVDPDRAGARWNLWLALHRLGPDETPAPPRNRGGIASGATGVLQRSLGTAEARTLKEGLPAIVRAMEARMPPAPRRGPPW